MNTEEPINEPINYDTVTEAMEDLRKKGYDAQFTYEEEAGCLICKSPIMQLSPEHFRIDHVYRFEGITDPGDSMILYAVSSTDNKTKGTVLNAYGVDSDPRVSKLMAQLKPRH
ncbi:MAG: phosphoribosylpyrophosphate synthetase [Chryseobacterium sp.]|nr:MAG: phosphoribosylpyrophosphate synthetase [Chryseobacterium sp.]